MNGPARPCVTPSPPEREKPPEREIHREKPVSGPRAAVIGWPVSHSLSPRVHRYWLDHYEIDGVYELQAVAPGDAEAFFSSFLRSPLTGGNVTIPHKETALRFCDILTDDARHLGAVNTLWRDASDRLCGGNSDGFGFLENLRSVPHGASLLTKKKPGKAVILGAGGGARAITEAVVQAGFAPVVVTNRTEARAHLLARKTGLSAMAVAWDERHAALVDAALLVNTTALGMNGAPPLDLDLNLLPKAAIVCDIVYAPLVTSLLHTAHMRGNPVVEGLGMLLHQAAFGFEKWFGLRPQVTDRLRHYVMQDE